jgi:hypothetical protein
MSGIFVEQSSIPSAVDLLNTTVSEVLVEGSSIVREAYRYDVKVTTNRGAPAVLADVEIKDPSGKVEMQALAGSDGWIIDLPIVGVIHDSSGSRYNEPHNLSVLYEGAVRMKDFNSTLYHFTSIEVLISDPEIEFTYPENGSWIPSRSFSVTGIISDPRPIVSLGMFLDEGSEVKITSGKTFTIPLSFGSDGEHDLRVRAMNADGKISDSTVHFGVDTIYPELEVTSPEEGVFTSSSNITVSGICEAGVRLLINEDLVNSTKGRFSYEVHLFEGWNKITVRAVDRAKNTVEITRNVYLDTTPPTLRILSPVNGTTVKNDYVDIEGAVSHDTVKVLINDVEIEFDIMGFSYRLEGLKEGENRIVLEAFDRTGSSTKTVIVLFVDSAPPWIEVVRPPPYTNKSTIVLSGNVERGSSVIVGGNLAQVEDGQFQSEVSLYLGANNISIIVTDEVGNSRRIFVETVLDTESPTFEKIEPIDRSTLSTMVAKLTGFVFDDHGIKSVWGYNSSSPRQLISTNGTIEWVVMLEPGENTFTLEAEDLAGNTRTIDLHYTYDSDQTGDRTKPVITILTPLSNETVPEGKVVVTGTATDDSTVVYVEIRVDDGDWTALSLNGSSFSMELDLERGVHLIEARATDPSGNTDSDIVKVTAVLRDVENGDGDKGGVEPVFIVLLVVIIVLAIVVLIYLVIRNNRLRKEWDDRKEPENPPSRERRGVRREEPRRSEFRSRDAHRRSSMSKKNLPRDLPDIQDRDGRRRPPMNRRG